MNCLTATETGSCAIAVDSNGWNTDGGFNGEVRSEPWAPVRAGAAGRGLTS